MEALKLLEEISTLMQVFFAITLVLFVITGVSLIKAGVDLKNNNLKTSGGTVIIAVLTALIFYIIIKSKTTPEVKSIEEQTATPAEPEIEVDSGNNECGTFTITHYPNGKNECEGDGCECID